MISITLLLSAFSAICLESLLVFGLSTGERCTSTPEACDPPLSCVGNSPNLRCFMKKGLGMKCGKDPFWVCEDGLMCVGGFCKRPVDEAGACNDSDDVCMEPMSCVGNSPNLRCFMKKGLGMKCGKDPFWVCEDGLMCVDRFCKKPVDEAGACNDSDDVCMEPLSCVGNSPNLRCFMKKGLGMKCGKDPFWVCEDGLMCVDGFCKKPVEEAGACNDSDDVCMEPLSCVGNSPNLRCFMKKRLGMKCGKDPFWVCEEGLVCIDGICKTAVGRAGACNNPDEGCTSPLHCVGEMGNKMCSKKRYRGMTCNDDPFHVCAAHLVCDEGICKKAMGRRGKCEVNFQICTPPLSCVGTPELKRCVMKKGEGMVCGKDPFWVCEEDLECVDFRCKAK